ncbi:glycine cleavage system aminomethyltransferase GcvT [Algimonas porphyrae]|uniref:aminomethyltransferase n=1 Tax=Algimonas porphyrae TaxID=1128113 RepID=A0ABQ5UZD5_9PROT|nr:glycine cleavage system aminomethyltransferase GcvT [Algimonas porphyrae]GLQ19731.1 aminomethyltransferase [Algimonas porphyrae]
MADDLKQTALHDLHVDLGAKMVPFAGYAMPVQYPMGVLKEHLHTRAAAGLFDVGHMGQCFIAAEDGTFETAAQALETLVPAAIADMEPGQQRYTQLLNDEGGILDDLMVSRIDMAGHDHMLYLVVNAGCKTSDFAHLEAHLPDGVSLSIKDDMLSLVALQGPMAVEIISRLNPDITKLVFMTHGEFELQLEDGPLYAHISRSGYTGEDGVEISAKHDDMKRLVGHLLSQDGVEPIGLGARDSLRLEAGLCLYGNDIDTTTSPIEAGLIWSVQKHRRTGEGYKGAARIAQDLAVKTRRLVGLKPEGRAPARAHTEIQDMNGKSIGEVTSGGFGPSVGGPVAMGYVDIPHNKAGTTVNLMIRGKANPAKIVKLPFVPNNYFRGE